MSATRYASLRASVSTASTVGAQRPMRSPALPAPPSDSEKYAYIHRNLPYLTFTLVVSASCVIISQIRFEMHAPGSWPFLAFTATYVIYQVISLPVNFTGRGFDLAAHRARIQRWRPLSYPSVDIYLPICGEPIELLRNTWEAVFELIAAYPGPAQAFVLDDGPSDEACSVSESFGFTYLRRPELRAYKKSGNLRYAFARTDGEYVVILDADFAPRSDFLAETLPYMDDPAIGIVQTPQFFRESPEQTWIENAAGAIQEVFYRSIQVARDRFGAAICVGTSAVYRRTALEPQGGPTLIPYAEDVHTGLDVRRAGWSMVYVPVVLSTGICPDNLDAFVRQQYRWCTGNAGVVFSRRLWSVHMPVRGPAHLHLRVLLLRLYQPAHLLRARHPDRHAGIPARPDQVAEFRHPRPRHGRRIHPVPAVASCTIWAVGLATGHRPGMGACLLDLGQRPRQDDGLASDPDTGQFAAAVPRVGHRLERRHGPALGGPGPLADGNPWLRAVRDPGVLRHAEPRRGQPRHLPGGTSRMKSRLVVLAALVAAAIALASTGVRFTLMPSAPPSAHASLPSTSSAYLGVYEQGSPPAYGPIANFAVAAGKQPNMVGYYSGWAEPFASSFARKIRRHGIIPYVQIDPTYASVSAIAAGAYDVYLRGYADSVRDFGHAVVIGFGHEMNGDWYSWGYGHVAPSTFVAAWRHIVTVVSR